MLDHISSNLDATDVKKHYDFTIRKKKLYQLNWHNDFLSLRIFILYLF